MAILTREEILKGYVDRLRNLNHITTLHNLATILEFGLLSRVEASNKKLILKDIASARLLRRRGRFNQYVPLFMAEGWTTSFYHYQKTKIDAIHIWIKESVIELDGVLISNGNLIHSETETFPISEINKLDGICIGEYSYWDIIEQKFTLPDNSTGQKIKNIRASELLVPRMIPVEYFKGIIYHSSSYRGRLRLDTIRKIMEIMRVEVPIYRYQYYGRSPRLLLVS